jgi:large subunit ribosomal protein L21
VTFDEVLLASSGDDVKVGEPVVKGAKVKAEVVRHGRDKKIIVFKRKRRKGYRKKQGHRQGFTEIRVNEVVV